eukprot:1989648-Pleurochrysis_carterae.AAC.2
MSLRPKKLPPLRSRPRRLVVRRSPLSAARRARRGSLKHSWSSFRGLQAAKEAPEHFKQLAEEAAGEAEETAAQLPQANEFIPLSQPDWERLRSLPSGKVRLSEARRGDVQYLLHIFSYREWQCKDVVTALEEARMLTDIFEHSVCEVYRVGWFKGFAAEIAEKYKTADTIIGLIIDANFLIARYPPPLLPVHADSRHPSTS